MTTNGQIGVFYPTQIGQDVVIDHLRSSSGMKLNIDVL